ncbi:MAG: ShlB/FhaC/HecB family hemolysin secretion/activation protein, partial [Trichodesmium sp. St16_bin2-tuft]|nr:ShlB/FhaC/HecB family hemolysin secretion/activation protein [Trichodesmium sp. St16_bin2-tuft]
MFKIITLIPSSFIIIGLFGNQALPETIDLDKLLNKTSLTVHKREISSFKKSKFSDELTPKLIDKHGEEKTVPKSSISQLKKPEQIKLITNSKTYLREKNITQIQTLTPNLSNTQHILIPFEIVNTLIPSQPSYSQNTQNSPRPLENPRPDPNRDRFLQPLPQPTKPETPKEKELERPTPLLPLPKDPDQQITVLKVLVSGSTILTPQEIKTLVEPLEGR